MDGTDGKETRIMMTIGSANGAALQKGNGSVQTGYSAMNGQTDAYSKGIQNQIANAQRQLQELSSNENMTSEEKMKKRQEIQQQINELNMQLRQQPGFHKPVWQL